MSSEENIQQTNVENVDESPTEPETPPEVSNFFENNYASRKEKKYGLLDVYFRR